MWEVDSGGRGSFTMMMERLWEEQIPGKHKPQSQSAVKDLAVAVAMNTEMSKDCFEKLLLCRIFI